MTSVRGHSTESGSATVYVLVIAVLVSLLAVAGVQIAMFVALKHRVSSVADLSAIAASRAATAGDDGCAAAEKLAGESDVRIASCQMDFEVATITAEARAQSWWAIRVRAEVTARAAPIDYVR